MKKVALLFVFTIFIFVGCTSNKQEMIIKSEKIEVINPIEVKKTSRDFGKINVFKHEKNADAKTKVFLSQCTIMGNIESSCKGFFYEVMYEEEWLVHSHQKVELNKLKEVSANKYYLKLQDINDDKVYNVTGTVKLKDKYTNYIKLELE